MSEDNNKRPNVGGQAVIEGVMMRSPGRIATAVRTPSGKIAIKDERYVSLIKRHKVLSVPVIRGAVVLYETIVLAIKALNYSAEQAASDEDVESEGKAGVSSLHLAGMVIVSLLFGFGLFFYLPLFVAERFGFHSGLAFNLIDGLVRLIVLFLYLIVIGRWKEMQRVFQYHGAEHKTIFAFESEGVISPEAARKYPRMHPRCSTSFLLVVVIVSLVVFVLLGKPETVVDRLVRFSFIPVIGGVSYELIRLSAKPRWEKFFSFFVWPGLFLQRFTTREPTEDQLEVASAALEACLKDG